jgi:DNA ligase 1
MDYSKLCELYEKISSTQKRLEKIFLISEFMKKTEDNKIIYLLLGKIYPDYSEYKLGISSQTLIKSVSKSCGISEKEIVLKWKKTGDLGEVTKEVASSKKQSSLFSKKLSIDRVISDLKKVSTLEGKGAVGKKIEIISGLILDASPLESKYIARTLIGDLRIGIQESTIREAISLAFFEGSKEASKKIQYAYDLNPDIAFVFETAKKGIDELEKTSLNAGNPIKAMLAQKVSTIEEAFEVVGKPAIFEFKYDGFRVIISKSKNEIKLFTRRLENVTKQFPDVIKNIKENIKGETFILDSEIIGYSPKTKKYLPFQSISQRIKRKYDIKEVAEKFPVEIKLFDLLAYEGDNYINKPFKTRSVLLRKIVKNKEYKISCAEQIITSEEEKANDFFKEALAKNQEGLMVKNIDGVYMPGSRVGYMVKLKPSHREFDLVITGAEYGTGKRKGWLSSFIVSCNDGDNFLEVGRVGSGIKEKENIWVSFDELTQLLKPLIEKSEGRDVKIKPKIIVTVLYQEIQKSPTYSSGFALRFPRVSALREDKPLSEINTLNDIEKEYLKQ